MTSQYLQQLSRTTVVSGSYLLPIADTGSGRLLAISKDNLFNGLYVQSSGYLNMNAYSLTLSNDMTFNQALTTTSSPIFNNLTLSGNAFVNGTISVLGTFNASGNMVFGDTSADTITQNASSRTLNNTETITRTATASTESIQVWKVSDDANASLTLSNGTSSSGEFAPKFQGINGTNNVALNFNGQGTLDTGVGNPVILFMSQIGSSNVTTRKAVSFWNLITPIMELTGGYNMQLSGPSTTPTIATAVADTVSLAAVDKAAGDRRLYIQSESGFPISIGNDRISFSANSGIFSVNGTDIAQFVSVAAGQSATFTTNSSGTTYLPCTTFSGNITAATSSTIGGGGILGYATSSHISGSTTAIAGIVGDFANSSSGTLTTAYNFYSRDGYSTSTGAATVRSTNQSTGATASMPATVVAGDLLVMFVCLDGFGTVATPSGWTQAAVGGTGSPYGGTTNVYVFTKVAAGTEGGTTVSVPNSSGFEDECHTTYAIQGGSSIEVSSIGTYGANSTNIVAPDVTPLGASGRILINLFTLIGNTTASITLPAGETGTTMVGIGGNNNCYLRTGYKSLSGLGATGTQTATIPISHPYGLGASFIISSSSVSSTTNFFGFNQIDTSVAVTNAAFRSQMNSGTNKYGLYFDGTANNYLAGRLGLNTTSPVGQVESRSTSLAQYYASYDSGNFLSTTVNSAGGFALAGTGGSGIVSVRGTISAAFLTTGISGTWAGNPISSNLGGLGVDTSAAAQGAILYKNATQWTTAAAGASGQILATQGASQNPKWVNQSMVLLGTASVNAQVASVNMTLVGSGNYKSYIIEMEDVIPSVAAVLWMRTSADNTNYDVGTTYTYCNNENSALSFSAGAAQITLAGVSTSVSPSGTQGGVSGRINIWNPSGVYRVKGLGEFSTSCVNDGVCRPAYTSFMNKNVKPVQSVQFLFSTGNVASGEFRLYGLTNS